MLTLRSASVFLEDHPFGIRTGDSGACTRVSPITTCLHADPATLTLLSIIVTNDRDEMGDLIEPDGLRNRDDYLRRPLVFWSHHRQTLPPIGTCLRLEVRPTHIVVETQFTRGIAFAEELFRMYQRRQLRGWSLGFRPLKTSPLAGRGGRRGLRVESWDLLEYSAVPLAERPDGLAALLRRQAPTCWRQAV